MLVQAVDNRLYEDPIIEGDGFFIRAESIEDPEIVIRYSPTTTLASSRDLAYKRFRELGIKVKMDDSCNDEDLFAFPPKWDKLTKGSRWTFQLKDKIPIPHSFKTVVDYPSTSSKFIAWELEFPLQEVLDFLDKKKFQPLLFCFLIGHQIHPPLTVKMQKTLISNLEDQLRVDYNVNRTDGKVLIQRLK